VFVLTSHVGLKSSNMLELGPTHCNNQWPEGIVTVKINGPFLTVNKKYLKKALGITFKMVYLLFCSVFV